MYRIWIVIISLTISLFPLTQSLSWAEEDRIRIDEVVITATRTEQDIEKISSNVTVITQEEIKKSTATTVQELLRSEEGLIIRDFYGTGTKTTVDMRGFTRGLNTVIMVDSRRLNEIDLSGVDWNTIPLENIERIEIVRGSGSVLYGDNAMAGAINIITKKGYTHKPEIVLDARAESFSGHAEYGTITGGNESIGYFFFMKHRETDGYRENSDFIATDISTRLNFKVNSNFLIDFAAGYHHDQQGLPGGLTPDEIKDDRRQSTKPNDNVNYNQRYVDIKTNFTLGTWGDLEIAYGYNNRKFDSSLIFGGPSYNTVRDTSTSALRAKITAEKKLVNFRNILIAGVDYYDSSANNRTTFLGSSTISDISKRETGLYIQNELFITEKVVMSLGYRYSDTKYKDTTEGFPTVSDEQKFITKAYRAGIAYNYSQGSKLFANYSKGYRLPTVDERIDFMGNISDLKPEKSDTYEIGIVQAFGKRNEARITGFIMNVEDELFVNPLSTSTNPNENLDKTRHVGIESSFSASVLEDMNLFGSFTYADAKFRSGPYDGNYIQLVPRYSANIGADYRFMKSFLFAINANWVGRKYLDNDVENKYDKAESYTTVNTKISYIYKNITAYVGVNNILNEKYSEYAVVGFTGNKNLYPAPERNYYGGIRIVF